MARDLTREHPLVDPVAAWDAGSGEAPAAGIAEPAAGSNHENEVTPGDLVTEPEPASPAELAGLLDPESVPVAVSPGPVLDYGSSDGRPDTLPVPVVQQQRPALAGMGAVAQDACPDGHPLFHGAKFCPECGLPATRPPVLPQDWTCSAGHQNGPSVKFCPEDGEPCPALRAPVSGATVAVELASQVQARPRAYHELSEQEKLERDRQHLQAVQAGNEMPPLAYQPPQSPQTETIHFIADGLTFAGVVWMKGQEITLDVGSPRWAEAQPWWNLTDFEQVDRYGEIKFRHGPWPGKRYVDGAGAFEQLAHLDREQAKQGARVSGPDAELLAQADQREQQRRGGVPQPLAWSRRG